MKRALSGLAVLVAMNSVVAFADSNKQIDRVATAGDHNLLINPMWGAATPPDPGSLVGVTSFP